MSNVFSRRTPYADDYGTCLGTWATLRIYPGELSPHEVTTRLGLEPTEVDVAGKPRTSPSGLNRTPRIHGWFLSSKGKVDSLDTRRHLDWLLRRLAPTSENLAQLQQLAGLRMAVSCAWRSRSGHSGPTLWPEQMKALADLNLECSFDVQFAGDEDDHWLTPLKRGGLVKP